MAHPILRSLVGALLCGALACASSADRLQGLDRRFHDNLAGPEDRAAFLKTPPAQRETFLKSKGLWDRWQALPEAERTSAARGELKPGAHEFAAFMAWGPPADTQRAANGGREVVFHTFIRCTSGPHAGRYVVATSSCDGTFDEIEVAIEGGIVTEIEVLH